jgi:sterol 3beta-glucosyltransferase
MRITIPTIGSRGDVQPYIALAQGLIRSGHRVTLASHPMMRGLAESYGVAFAPIGPDINLAEEVAVIRHSARNPILGLIQGMRFGFEILERSHDDILTLCKETDLVVVPTAIAAGKNEAELLQLPYLSINLMPWAIPWDDPERAIYKRVAYGVMDKLIHLITTLPLNRIRKRQGLPPVGQEGFTSTHLDLVPISPVIYPPNPLWESHHKVVGYWFTEAPSDWEPSTDLLSFLEEGGPPVLISLGAMSWGDDDALESANLFVDAIQEAGIRAIIQGWEAGIKLLRLPPNIKAAASLPHSWLLPQCTGIVHHGGYGTTAAGLRAGIPALVIPHIADQFYWGKRISGLGVGPQPIPRTKLDKNGLVAALEELIRNEQIQMTAAKFGKQIRSENGVENAVQLIEETFV